jgi:hypothetical protein
VPIAKEKKRGKKKRKENKEKKRTAKSREFRVIYFASSAFSKEGGGVTPHRPTNNRDRIRDCRVTVASDAPIPGSLHAMDAIRANHATSVWIGSFWASSASNRSRRFSSCFRQDSDKVNRRFDLDRATYVGIPPETVPSVVAH